MEALLSAIYQLLLRLLAIFTPRIKKEQYGTSVQTRRGQLVNVPANGPFSLCLVQAADETISEWVVKVAPSAKGLAQLHTTGQAGYTNSIQIQTLYEMGLVVGEGAMLPLFSAQTNPLPVAVPIFGRCYQIHGTGVIAQFQQGNTVDTEYEMAVIPGRLEEYELVSTFASTMNPAFHETPIAQFAMEFKLVTELVDVGDQVRFLDSAHNEYLTLTGPFNDWKPIDAKAQFMRYYPGAVGATKNYFAFKVKS